MSKKILMRLAIMSLMVMLLPLRSAWAKTTTIAVIDSGIDGALPHLCKFGHKSFAKNLPNPLSDENGHGTHIAGLIGSTAGDGDYCIVSIKFYDSTAQGDTNLNSLINAVQYAINIKVDFINISGGGSDFSALESKTIKKALNNNIKVVVAAGNENSNLNLSCNYFPACYDKRLVVVGNLRQIYHPDGSVSTAKCSSSNYGKWVNRWEIGTNILSTLPGGKMGYKTGTSQATAIATGKLVKEKLAERRSTHSRVKLEEHLMKGPYVFKASMAAHKGSSG